MSNISKLLVDSMLLIPAETALAERARVDLHYMASTGSRQNPYESVYVYDEVPNGLLVPRHYLPLAETNYRFIGPTEYPVIHDSCDIAPWGKIESQLQLQVEAMEFLRQYGRTPAESDAMVSVRCGEGKTFIGLRAIFDYGYHTIILAHTEDILKEWRKVILAHTTLKEDNIGEIISGRYALAPITLALVQSVLALPPEKKQEVQLAFGCMLADESHHYSSKTFSQISNMFPCRRIGLSATLAREDGLSWVFKYAFGPRLFWKTSTRKRAQVAFRRIRVRDIDYPDNYAEAVTLLAQSKQYLNWIESDIRSSYLKGHKQLIVASRKELLWALADRIKDMHPGVNTREVPANERQRNLHTRPVVLSVDHFAKEGLNEPTLTHVRVITPMKDRNAVTQTVGRLERETEDKTVMQAVFYASDYRMFLNTLERTKESLSREGYRVTSEFAE